MPSILFASTNSFRGQLPGEQTRLVSRRHWVALFWPTFWLVIFTILPIGVYYVLQYLNWYLSIKDIFWFLAIIYYFFLWCALFYNLMLYFLNIIIVSNKRVINNQQLGFFQYQTSELEIQKIQDVQAKVEGFWAAILHFGDLEIQTAGTQNKFYFYTLPSPEKIKQLIISLQNS